LAAHFVQLASVRFGKLPLPVHSDTIAWFERYDWPGNVRELEHIIYREFLLAEGPAISIPPPHGMRPAGPSTDPQQESLNYLVAKKRAINEFESRFLTRLIEQTDGNISAAARLSGTERRHLGRLLHKHQLTKHQQIKQSC